MRYLVEDTPSDGLLVREATPNATEPYMVEVDLPKEAVERFYRANREVYAAEQAIRALLPSDFYDRQEEQGFNATQAWIGQDEEGDQ